MKSAEVAEPRDLTAAVRKFSIEARSVLRSARWEEDVVVLAAERDSREIAELRRPAPVAGVGAEVPGSGGAVSAALTAGSCSVVA
jgi:hypothetical protein